MKPATVALLVRDILPLAHVLHRLTTERRPGLTFSIGRLYCLCCFRNVYVMACQKGSSWA